MNAFVLSMVDRVLRYLLFRLLFLCFGMSDDDDDGDGGRSSLSPIDGFVFSNE